MMASCQVVLGSSSSSYCLMQFLGFIFGIRVEQARSEEPPGQRADSSVRHCHSKYYYSKDEGGK